MEYSDPATSLTHARIEDTTYFMFLMSDIQDSTIAGIGSSILADFTYCLAGCDGNGGGVSRKSLRSMQNHKTIPDGLRNPIGKCVYYMCIPGDLSI